MNMFQTPTVLLNTSLSKRTIVNALSTRRIKASITHDSYPSKDERKVTFIFPKCDSFEAAQLI